MDRGSVERLGLAVALNSSAPNQRMRVGGDVNCTVLSAVEYIT